MKTNEILKRLEKETTGNVKIGNDSFSIELLKSVLKHINGGDISEPVIIIIDITKEHEAFQASMDEMDDDRNLAGTK